MKYPLLSTAEYITSTQPSVVEISNSVSIALKMSLKFWLNASCQTAPCSTQRAASFIKPSEQNSSHSQRAWHSFRQAWQCGLPRSLSQVS